MNEDWRVYVALPITVHVMVQSDDGETVSFQPGDDPPEWARRKMGAHCFGFRMSDPRAKGLEIVSSKIGDGGLPDVIDVVCNEPQHRPGKLVRRFEAVEYVGDDTLGRPEFRWWINRLVGAQVGDLDESGKPFGWTRPKQVDGRWRPGSQVPHSINLRHDDLNLPVSWSDMQEILTDARHAGHDRLVLRDLVYARTS